MNRETWDSPRRRNRRAEAPYHEPRIFSRRSGNDRKKLTQFRSSPEEPRRSRRVPHVRPRSPGERGVFDFSGATMRRPKNQSIGATWSRPSQFAMALDYPARARAGLTFGISPYRPDKCGVTTISKNARPLRCSLRRVHPDVLNRGRTPFTG